MNDLIITPLGTVSPYPKDDKNCPGFLIECNNKKILLDCGSGISRLLNMEKDLNDLIIIISHLHKDHYSDLSSIGYASYVYHNLGYLDKKIKVYIPEGDTYETYRYYTDKDGWGSSRPTTKNIIDYEYLRDFGKENYLEFIPYNSNEKIIHGDMEITFSLNPHPLVTFSSKITNKQNTIVYSSDTGFKKNTLTKFAKNIDLLICESTYLKGQIKQEDSHLFAHEAATIARLANVKKLLLTHFWPEIDKQEYIKEAKEIFENTEAAIEGKKLILRR